MFQTSNPREAKNSRGRETAFGSSYRKFGNFSRVGEIEIPLCNFVLFL